MSKKTMTSELKRAVRASGLPLNRIAVQSGIQVAALRRFMAGTQSLRLDKADLVATYFRLELKRKG
ncbi:MAG: hypothetical protein ACP5QA_16185 [Phycisphaerae bacterium]